MDGDLNATLGESGACPEIVHNGKTWKVGYPTQKAKAILNNLVVAYASAEIQTASESLPPALYQQMLSDFTTKIGQRYYKTWHQGWIEIAMGQDGDILFLLSLVKLHQPNATENDARMLFEECGPMVQTAMAQVMPVFFQILEADYPSQLPKENRAQLRAAAENRFRSLLKPTD